jgi:serine/threonine protein kinase
MSDQGTERGDAAPIELRGVLPAGTSLRGYELKSILGQGAFGITYRALDTTLHRDVAIKEYLPTTLALREGRTTVLPRSPEHAEQFAWGRERFLDEARILARLDRTSSIIRVFDFLEANGTAYMVMALVEGETLHKRLQREQRLTPEAIERIVFPLLDGLEEVHAATFLHRDIKPANIMLDARGQPTLIDFGASRAAMAERSTTMTAIFTPGYAAAEQFVASSKLGPATDIYGLSATLYHAITGRIPPSAIERIMNDEYEPLTKLKPAGFSPDLLAGIDAGLAIRAADRPQSIAEWRGLLGNPSSVEVQAATRMVARPGRLARSVGRIGRTGRSVPRPALRGAMAAILLMVAGAGYYAWTSNAPGTVTSAALTLSAEQLEQALAERRKADGLAAEKKRLVEEAQRKADADAEANRRAESELREARLARQKAEDELAKLKADFEARRQADTGRTDQADIAGRRLAEQEAQRKAETEAAALRQAEEEARKKASAEAEAKRLADEALAKAQAEQQQAEDEARHKADLEAARLQADGELRLMAEAAATTAKEKGDAEKQKKAAEAAETALRLEPRDRQRLQVALTSLGFDTRGSDGALGPRSREMIAAWQKARKLPETAFLSGAQQQALLKEAAPAVGKFDDEERMKLEEEVRRVAAARPPPPSATGPTAADGLWRGTYACTGGTPFTLNLEIRLTNGSGRWSAENWSSSNDYTLGLQMTTDGTNAVATRQRTVTSNGSPSLTATLDGNRIRGTGREAGFANTCTLSLTRQDTPAAPAPSASSSRVPAVTPAAPSTMSPSGGAYDGVYTGALRSNFGGAQQTALSASGGIGITIRLEIANGRGSGTLNTPGCGVSPLSVTVSPTGDIKGEGVPCDGGASIVIEGRADREKLDLALTSGGTRARALLTRGTSPSAAAPSAGAYDGIYTGGQGSPFRFIRVELTNGRGSGTATTTSACTSSFSFLLSSTGTAAGEGVNCASGQSFTVSGGFEGSRLVLNLPGGPGSPRFVLARQAN